LVRRRQIADIYKEQLQNFQDIILPPFDDEEYQSSWHLFVIRLKGELENRRAEIFRQLREAGIGVQVHHIPVYLHPYYQKRGYQIGLCSAAEKFYQTTISLPIFPNLDEKKQDEVIKQITLLIK